jgi:hypothetical protein
LGAAKPHPRLSLLPQFRLNHFSSKNETALLFKGD